MSMTVFVVVEGKGREAIKVTPMRQLGAVVEEVLGKTKRNITKEEFTLTKMKKVLDMADTVRLAGVVDRDTIHLDRIDGRLFPFWFIRVFVDFANECSDLVLVVSSLSICLSCRWIEQLR